jgi:hypothetical protein
MRYDLIRNGKVISHFEDTAISTKQLIDLHRLGYKFAPRVAAYCEPLPQRLESELPMLLQHQALS